MTNQLAATLEEMTLNDLGNEQARESLESTIIMPLRKLHDDLLTPLRGAVGEVVTDGQISQTGREKAQALADQSVEVMQSILAQMSLWESFIDVINQLKHVINQQTDVLKSSEQIEKDRTEKLFDE